MKDIGYFTEEAITRSFENSVLYVTPHGTIKSINKPDGVAVRKTTFNHRYNDRGIGLLVREVFNPSQVVRRLSRKKELSPTEEKIMELYDGTQINHFGDYPYEFGRKEIWLGSFFSDNEVILTVNMLGSANGGVYLGFNERSGYVFDLHQASLTFEELLNYHRARLTEFSGEQFLSSGISERVRTVVDILHDAYKPKRRKDR